MKNRIYKYSDIKNFIEENLEEFNFIIESKHIFNSEFKKHRKFFKGLLTKTKKVKNNYFWEGNPESETNQRFVTRYPVFNTYEDSKCTGKYITLSTKYVTDIDMEVLYKDFPNLKTDYDVLLSLKDKVRSGRRPKDLEKDYEKERIRKAALEDKATCGICYDHWELVDWNGKKNIIADHGFNIALGYRDNNCFGARFKSWEKSTESKVEYIRIVLKPTLNKVIENKPTQATVDSLIKWVERYKVAMDEYYALPYSKRRETEAPVTPEYTLPGQRIGYRLSAIRNINLSLITEVWLEYKRELEANIERFELAITNWTLQPTPRERLNKVEL